MRYQVVDGRPLVVGRQDENAGQEEAGNEDQQSPTPQPYSPHRLDGDALGQHRRRRSAVAVVAVVVVAFAASNSIEAETKLSHV